MSIKLHFEDIFFIYLQQNLPCKTRIHNDKYAHNFAMENKYSALSIGWRRPMGCLIVIGHFPPKSPIISGSLAKNDVQIEASCGSLPPCNCMQLCIILRISPQKSLIISGSFAKNNLQLQASHGSSPPWSCMQLCITLRVCLKLQVNFAKKPPITGLFCGKWPIKIKYPTGLRHPVHCVQLCVIWRISTWQPFAGRRGGVRGGGGGVAPNRASMLVSNGRLFWRNFSKVSCILILHGKFSSVLTFWEFNLTALHPNLSRHACFQLWPVRGPRQASGVMCSLPMSHALCVAVRCSALQCVAVCCVSNGRLFVRRSRRVWWCVA